MRKQTVAHIAFILGLIFTISDASCVIADPILSFNPPTQTVMPGETFDVDVVIAGVTDLFGFQFDLSFDSSVLSANSVTEGPFLKSGGPTLFDSGTISTGAITFILDTLLGPVPGVDGGGILVTINFTAVTLGRSALTLSKVNLADSQDNPISPFTLENGTVAVVPEPVTLVLLSTGLIGFFAYERSRSQRRFLLDSAKRGRS